MRFEEIGIGCGDVEAKISPARGALVSALMVAGKDVLYLDRVSFDDETKNVRGGIPVLFPYAGKLADGIFLAANTKMGQHGFGRNRQWAVTERKPWLLRMKLAPDTDSRSVYPYDFIAEQTCRILAAATCRD
jgi:D-hexose-6-phosphate mutarotase